MPVNRTITCSKCSQKLNVTVKDSPSRVRCPTCQTILKIPGGSQSVSNGGDFNNPWESTRNGSPPSYQTPAITKRNRRRLPVWAWVVGGWLVVMLLLCGGTAIYIAAKVSSGGSRFASGDTSGYFGNSSSMLNRPINVATTKVDPVLISSFPSLGVAEQTFPSGVKSYFVQLMGDGKPGHDMKMRVYIPPGNHEPRSLRCVLVAPAGTPMFYGAKIEPHDTRNQDYHDETLPYAEAGLCVINYSLDGAVEDYVLQADEATMMTRLKMQYPKFRDAGGGVINGRIALEYAIAKLPMVNPAKISSAGHSSAATISLLLAASEPKLHKSIAYAAVYDVEKRMADMLDDTTYTRLFPGLAKFFHETSPKNKISDIQCRVMIFHSADDDNVPIADAREYIQSLQQAGKRLHPVIVQSGGHYRSMVAEGIPEAIKWLLID